MKYLLSFFLSVGLAYAAPPMPKADPPAPTPTPAPVAPPPFILPTPVPGPAPNPPVPPPAIQLTVGHPYVLQLNAASVSASPKGLVWMRTKAEPWSHVDDDGVTADYSGNKSVCIIGAVKGASGPCVLTISQGHADGSVTELASVSLMVGAPVPPGPGPTPPKPPLPPDPFAAGMTATDAASLRMLIIYDDTAVAKLTAGQKAAIYGATTRSYLNSHTAVGPDGKTHEWRIWDVTTDPTNDDPMFAKGFKRPRASVPWIELGNGTTGFEGPLPERIEDVTALLKTYGGN